MHNPIQKDTVQQCPSCRVGQMGNLEAPQRELPAANSWEARLRCACYDDGRQRNHNQHACLCRSLQAPHPAGVVAPSSDRISMSFLELELFPGPVTPQCAFSPTTSILTYKSENGTRM